MMQGNQVLMTTGGPAVQNTVVGNSLKAYTWILIAVSLILLAVSIVGENYRPTLITGETCKRAADGDGFPIPVSGTRCDYFYIEGKTEEILLATDANAAFTAKRNDGAVVVYTEGYGSDAFFVQRSPYASAWDVAESAYAPYVKFAKVSAAYDWGYSLIGVGFWMLPVLTLIMALAPFAGVEIRYGAGIRFVVMTLIVVAVGMMTPFVNVGSATLIGIPVSLLINSVGFFEALALVVLGFIVAALFVMNCVFDSFSFLFASAANMTKIENSVLPLGVLPSVKKFLAALIQSRVGAGRKAESSNSLPQQAQQDLEMLKPEVPSMPMMEKVQHEPREQQRVEVVNRHQAATQEVRSTAAEMAAQNHSPSDKSPHRAAEASSFSKPQAQAQARRMKQTTNSSHAVVETSVNAEQYHALQAKQAQSVQPVKQEKSKIEKVLLDMGLLGKNSMIVSQDGLRDVRWHIGKPRETNFGKWEKMLQQIELALGVEPDTSKLSRGKGVFQLDLRKPESEWRYVVMREAISSPRVKSSMREEGVIKGLVGCDAMGEPMVEAISHHTILSGMTRQRKSTLFFSLVFSVMAYHKPSEVQFWVSDVKRNTAQELGDVKRYVKYTATTFDLTLGLMLKVKNELALRRKLFAKEGVTDDVFEYNTKVSEPLPVIFLVLEELQELLSIESALDSRGLDASDKADEEDVLETEQKMGNMRSFLETLARTSAAFGIYLFCITQSPDQKSLPRNLVKQSHWISLRLKSEGDAVNATGDKTQAKALCANSRKPGEFRMLTKSNGVVEGQVIPFGITKSENNERRRKAFEWIANPNAVSKSNIL